MKLPPEADTGGGRGTDASGFTTRLMTAKRQQREGALDILAANKCLGEGRESGRL